MTISEIKELLAVISMPDDERLSALRTDQRIGVQKLIQQWEKAYERQRKEHQEYEAMQSFENEARSSGYQVIAGIDEVGRGPLCGPVTAACVVLPSLISLKGLTDSKKLSEKKRKEYAQLIEQQAIAIGKGEATPQEIDRINIYEASKLAMMRALEEVRDQCTVDFLLVDAMTLPVDLPQEHLIKGDARSISIAAASVIAKVTRDELMKEFDEMYPEYGFKSHMGYGTKEHLRALDTYGPSKIHRMSFSPVRERAD
ncbi:ribonuclease HII [Salisediminibacterium beveridgei]|uniref:Ribonuclease HII n=1 Tax=Salisediminibacterium beveridgei TaxID=632773 RepID=A0A1D7QW12_9BACI|nr:ribonuclease HII [Salisediminibacterium beveridgei]AOM83204.1 Ribonuclease HII [Salisediminibacterium beveridgei]